MFKLIFADNFWRLYKQEFSTLRQLAFDPRSPGLKCHKVGTRNFGERWAARVTGDLRIIWDYGSGAGTILILGFGGHSGRRKVYR